MTVRCPLRFLVAILACAIPAAAHAGSLGATSGAGPAYERAQQAVLGGNYARAAELFELADSLTPSPAALRSAARARLAAGDRAPAATHAAALLTRYPEDESSRELGLDLLHTLSPRLIRLAIVCESACALEIDGRSAGADTARRWLLYVEPSSHRLAARFGDGTEVTRRTFGGPGTEIDLQLAPPAPSLDLAAGGAASAGLDRRWVGVGVGVTAALIGSALWSWSDARDARIDPLLSRDPSIAHGRERRTTALLGASLATATTTAILAMFTDWSRSGERAIGVSAGPGGALVGVGGSF